MRAKLSCFLSCFGSRGTTSPENESSHFSVAKSPEPSATLCSGILGSFMSKRSCSRGTWDISATDGEKSRSPVARNADCVTLATVKYLELFTNNAKNDDNSTVLSEVRGAQDSIRSVRTGSEYPVSRSSTFTAMGRASREPSRLGAIHHSQLQQQSATGQRRSASSTRRSGPHKTLPDTVAAAPPSDPTQVPIQPASRKSGALIASHALSPFTNKTRVFNSATRSRSDRLSPSAAACLLPAPSIKNIARAQTALPVVSAGSAALSSSASMSDLQAGGVSEVSCTATVEQPPMGASARRGATALSSTGYVSSLITSAPLAMAAADGKPSQAAIVRRSRLFTETGAAQPSVAGQAITPSSPPQPAQLPQPVADAAVLRQAFGRSHTLATGTISRAGAGGVSVGGADRLPFRRPSILFSRDGDVTVTGLPPSCLTAGRAPRCRRDGGGPLSTMYGEEGLSGAHLCSTSAVHGVYTRRSVDGVGMSSGLNLACQSDGRDGVPAVFLASRSHDSGSRCQNSNDRMDLVLTLNNGSSGGPAAPSVRSRAGSCTSRAGGRETAGGRSIHNSSHALSCDRNAVAEAPQEDQLGDLPDDGLRTSQQQPGGGRVPRPSASVLATANSSCDSHSHRCEWAGSSMFTQSRFSNSSRLTHGNTGGGAVMTPTGSVVSNCLLDKLPQPRGGTTAGALGSGPNPIPSGGGTAGDGSVAGRGHRKGVSLCGGTARDGEEEYGGGGGSQIWYSGIEGSSGFGGFPSGAPVSAAGAASAVIMASSSVGAPGCYGLGPAGSSCEPKDVTSALTRLQEACLAAVAQGELRSQRLCLRSSTDQPRPGQRQSMQLYVAEPVGDGERASSVGPGRIMASIGAAAGPAPALRGGSRGQPRQSPVKSASVLFPPGALACGPYAASALRKRSPQVLPQPAAAESAGPAISAVPLAAATKPAAEAAAPVEVDPRAAVLCGSTTEIEEVLESGAGNAAAVAVVDADGNEISVGEVVLDGRPSQAVSRQEPTDAADCGDEAAEDPATEEYRTRLLNVLLRGDFLHDTYDSVAHGSEDEDEGVVEYRYGGFELGGGDGNFSFSRQVSFMEALRKCKATTGRGV